MYGNGSDVGVERDGNRDKDGGIDGDNCYHWAKKTNPIVTNFIQLVSLQPVDQFLQTKLHWKAPNKGYLHICGRYKSNNKWLRYQAISNCKSFVY